MSPLNGAIEHALTKYLFRDYRRRGPLTQGARMITEIDELLTTSRSARTSYDRPLTVTRAMSSP
jgi:hypothetical protein